MPMKQGVTKRKVIQYKEKYPGMRAAEIARRVDITRERVRQILKAAGLPTTVEKEAPNTCISCGKKVSKSTTTCMDCIKKAAWTEVVCANCGVAKKVRTSTYKYREKSDKYSGKYYCDRACFYGRQNAFGRENESENSQSFE